jgi:hypothetical protein
VFDVSSFCRAECCGILVCSTDRCESCPAGRRLIPAGGSKRAKMLRLSRRSLVCGGSHFAGAGPSLHSSVWSSVITDAPIVVNRRSAPCRAQVTVASAPATRVAVAIAARRPAAALDPGSSGGHGHAGSTRANLWSGM